MDGISFNGGALGTGAEAGGISRRELLSAGIASLAAASVLSAGELTRLGVPHHAATAGGELAGRAERGAMRRFTAPYLRPGDLLEMPEGIEVTSLWGFNTTRRGIVPGGPFAWPQAPAEQGGTVDLSVMPRQGAPSHMAVLSGFRGRGSYVLTDSDGANAQRVTWDARKLPHLLLWGEWGGAQHAPFLGGMYTLVLQPFARQPIA